MKILAAAGCLLLCGVLICPCLFAEGQVQPQGKPTPTPTPSSVIVVNGDAAPVPVKVVSAGPNGVVVTMVENLVVTSGTTFIVDVSGYRFVSFLGRYISTTNPTIYVHGSFIDTLNPDPDYRLRNRIFGGSATLRNSEDASDPGILSGGPYMVAGPFLEVRIVNASPAIPMDGNMTVKVYFQK